VAGIDDLHDQIPKDSYSWHETAWIVFGAVARRCDTQSVDGTEAHAPRKTVKLDAELDFETPNVLF